MIKRGERSSAVKEYQRDLEALGYDLPKWGADGAAGTETFNATEQFAEDQEIEFDPDSEIIENDIIELAAKFVDDREDEELIYLPSSMIDYRDEAQKRRRKKKKPVRRERPIGEVTGITLHQTATFFNGRCPYTLDMHFITHPNGESHYINDILKRMAQAQSVFNKHDVGIECDGYYSGIGTDERYFWKPKSRPNRKPMTPTDDLIDCTRATIEYICEEVSRRGGEIKYIHAHRQTSASRTSDPGSLLWKALGIWAQDKLGLSDGGKGKTWLSGKPIPESWDPRYTGIKYR